MFKYLYIVLAITIIACHKPHDKKQESVNNNQSKTAHASDLGEEITTASGLKYIDEIIGIGRTPQIRDKVKVHYTGTLENGNKFDSSRDRNKPFEFTLGVGRVIKGWDEAIALMSKGEKRTLVIPPDLGYGSRPKDKIPPNSTLIFEVELIDFQ